MLKRDLILVDTFSSELKGQAYDIYVFIDEITLNTYYGCNLGSLKVGEKYKCELSYNPKKKHNRLVVNRTME